MNSFYVYGYWVDGDLWIIGKGSGGRDRKHFARANRYAKGLPLHRIYGWQRELGEAIRRGAKVSIRRLADNLSETEALERECKLIDELQPLTNKQPGGEGGRAGGMTRKDTLLLQELARRAGFAAVLSNLSTLCSERAAGAAEEWQEIAGDLYHAAKRLVPLERALSQARIAR
jgi:hypothetical protein